MWTRGAKDRWMNFYQVYIVSLIARIYGGSGFKAESLREASEGAGRDLAGYVRLLGMEALDVEDALALLNAATALADHLKVSAGGDTLEVGVHKPSCRMCPSLLNGCGQPTPKCPLYGLVKGFLEGQEAVVLDYDGVEPVDGGEWCILRYKVKESRATGVRRALYRQQPAMYR